MERATVHEGKKLPDSMRSQGRFLGLVNSWPILLCLWASCATPSKPPDAQASEQSSATGSDNKAMLESITKAATSNPQGPKGGTADVHASATFAELWVQWAASIHPEQNWALIHTDHNAEGTFIHDHIEEKLPNSTRGYEVYHNNKGIVFRITNKGDGGPDNWAWAGDFARDNMMIVAAPR